MQLQVIEASDSLTHVALNGTLDIAGANRIDMEFTRVTAGNGKPTIVDMSDVAFVASMGIRLLFSCAKALAQEDAKMVLLNPHELVEETLRTGGVTLMIPVAHSREEAMEHLGTA